MKNKYYGTKWDGLTNQEAYNLSKKLEDELAKFLINKCSFKQIIPTRDSIITLAKDKNLILPDLMGIHKNGKEYFIELKSKNRRMIFNDNGIDLDKAEAYLKIEKEFNKKCLLVFLDDEFEWKKTDWYIVKGVRSWFKDDNGNCIYYGNWIENLYEETPQNPITKTFSNGKEIICFPLNNMKRIDYIFKERQTELNFGVIQ